MFVDEWIQEGDARPVTWIRAQARRRVLNARADELESVYPSKSRASLFAWAGKQLEELADDAPWPELPAVAPDVQPRQGRRAKAHEHACPTCGAGPSEPCRGRRGPRASVHQSRLDVSSS
ncbi:zinc finger domain-containing protein [Amycolatopsis anabasis]|uniref:zinc finger domain-containing protein n=1 Tax=Amycolatopsis anabasis TaxID=1840409 RepID=UPI00131D5820|nr:hypothetical protein [Amycolatopsis anabasis]